MSFEKFVGQDSTKRSLIRAINGKTPHALVITGEDGMGKTSFAMEFARGLVCEHPTENGACDECNACKYALGGSHPDIIYVDIDDEKGLIKVDTIRERVIGEVAISPQLARYKVFLIEADGLNEAGQNALLKSLEEPPANVGFVLTCVDATRLLPTVMSRLVEFKLLSYTNQEIVKVLRYSNAKLEPEERMDEDKLSFFANFSSGVIGRAQSLMEDKSFSRMRDEMLELCLEIRHLSYTALLYEKYPQLEKEKASIDEVISLMTWIYGDLCLLRKSANSPILNEDYRQKLSQYIEKNPQVTTAKYVAAVGHLTTFSKRLESNMNFELAACDMLISLKKELT